MFPGSTRECSHKERQRGSMRSISTFNQVGFKVYQYSNVNALIYQHVKMLIWPWKPNSFCYCSNSSRKAVASFENLSTYAKWSISSAEFLPLPVCLSNKLRANFVLKVQFPLDCLQIHILAFWTEPHQLRIVWWNDWYQTRKFQFRFCSNESRIVHCSGPMSSMIVWLGM